MRWPRTDKVRSLKANAESSIFISSPLKFLNLLTIVQSFTEIGFFS